MKLIHYEFGNLLPWGVKIHGATWRSKTLEGLLDLLKSAGFSVKFNVRKGDVESIVVFTNG
jgi:hypothetical protein